MTDLAKLVVRLEAQSSQLLTELDKANKKLTGFERQVNQSLGRISKQFSSFGSKIAGFGAVFLGGIGFNAIVKASAEASKNFALLENAVTAAGTAAGGRTARDFEAVSKQLESISTFSDDAIQNVQQLLLRFQSIRTDKFDEATKRVLDLSAALGIDLQSAAKLVGKALSDPEKGTAALAKAGVVLSDSQKKLIKDLNDTGRAAEAQGILLDALSDKFGGAAEAARNTFSGALEGVKNAVNNLLEVDGGLPAATANLNELSKILQDPATKNGADALFSGILTAATAAAGAVFKLAAGIKILAGGGDNEQVNVDNEIIDLEKRIQELQRTRGPNEQRAKELEYLQTQLEGAKLRYEELGKAAAEALKPVKFDPNAAFQLPDITVTDGFTEAQKRLQKQLEASGAALTKSLQTPLERMRSEIAEADKLLAANVITFGTWQRAVQKAAADLDPLLGALSAANGKVRDLGEGIADSIKNTDAGIDIPGAVNEQTDRETDALKKSREAADRQAQVFADQASRNIQDILADGITDGLENGFEDGAEGALKAFGNMLTRMAAQAIAADLAGKIFGTQSSDGSGGASTGGLLSKGIEFLGGLFDGSRDSGGRGRRGRPVLIGVDAQPEAFVPDTAGEFYPADEWMGGGSRSGQKITQNIYTTSPITTRSARQLELEAARGQRAASARLG